MSLTAWCNFCAKRDCGRAHQVRLSYRLSIHWPSWEGVFNIQSKREKHNTIPATLSQQATASASGKQDKHSPYVKFRLLSLCSFISYNHIIMIILFSEIWVRPEFWYWYSSEVGKKLKHEKLEETKQGLFRHCFPGAPKWTRNQENSPVWLFRFSWNGPGERTICFWFPGG